MNPIMLAAFTDELALIHGIEKGAGFLSSIGKVLGGKLGPAAGKTLAKAPKIKPPAIKSVGQMATKGVPHGRGGWGVPQATPQSTAQTLRGQLKAVGGVGYGG